MESRLCPSEHTLRVALERIRIACDRAARAATAAITRVDAPHTLAMLATRRFAYVDSASLELPEGRRPIRTTWSEHATSSYARARRWLGRRESARRTYVRQVLLTESAIAACTDVLAMTLPERVRGAVEREHGALELDRRLLRALADDASGVPQPSRRTRPTFGVAHAGGVTLGAIAVTLWDLRVQHGERARRGAHGP